MASPITALLEPLKPPRLNVEVAMLLKKLRQYSARSSLKMSPAGIMALPAPVAVADTESAHCRTAGDYRVVLSELGNSRSILRPRRRNVFIVSSHLTVYLFGRSSSSGRGISRLLKGVRMRVDFVPVERNDQ
jgi:hypothetical protein